MGDALESLKQSLGDFVRERDWDQFHTPKNLAMAIAGEAGELVAEFQWLTDADAAAAMRPGEPLHSRVQDEAADVLLYLLRLADVGSFDLIAAGRRKLIVNGERYPVHLAWGNATKYTKLGDGE